MTFDPQERGEILVTDTWDEDITIEGAADTEEKQGFRIKDLGQAIRFAHALHRHRQAQHKIVEAADKNIETLEAEIAAIEEWRDKQVAEIKRDHCDFLEGALVTWHRHLYKEQPKGNAKKELPFVTLKRKSGSESIEVEDEIAFYQWAFHADQSLLRDLEPKEPDPKPDKNAIKAAIKSEALGKLDGKLVTRDGEVVPGVRVVKSDDEFVVEVV